jgi:hypothetical protein
VSFGDPHTTSLSGTNYDMNSLGAYTLLRTSNVLVQAFHLPCVGHDTCITTSEVSLIYGSTIVVVSAPDDGTDTLGVATLTGSGTDFVPVVFPDVPVLQGVTVEYYLGGSRHKVLVTTDEGIVLTAASYSGILSAAIEVPRQFEGQTSGLCGAFDGVLEHDFEWRVCPPGRKGEFCHLLNCPGEPDCNDRGVCRPNAPGVLPFCECRQGFAGDDCSELVCGNNQCGGAGRGECVLPHNASVPECACSNTTQGALCQDCIPGYGGANCTVEVDCPLNGGVPCGPQGQCVVVDEVAQCQCASPRAGPACEYCELGLGGADCDVPVTCTANCSDSGFCTLAPNTAVPANVTSPLPGVCVCKPGYDGGICNQLVCPGSPACSNHGFCTDSLGPVQCLCDAGWIGDDCSLVAPNTTAAPPTTTATAAPTTAAATTTPAPPTANVNATQLRFEDILSQAWIDNIVAERFLLPSHDTVTLDKHIGADALGAGGFMLSSEEATASFFMTPCGLPVSNPAACTGSDGFTLEFWVKVGARDLIQELYAGTGRGLLVDPNATLPSRNAISDLPELDERLLNSTCHHDAFVSFASDARRNVSFSVLCRNNKLTLAWGAFVLDSSIRLYDGLWTHVSVSWRCSDGRFDLRTNSPGVDDQSDVFVGVMAGCGLAPVGQVSVARLVEEILALESEIGSRDPLMPFAGAVDELRFWRFARVADAVAEDRYVALSTFHEGLLAYVDFNTVQRESDSFEGLQYSASGLRCPILVLTEQEENVTQPVFAVSTAPLRFSETARCRFFVDGLEEQARALCHEWFYESELAAQCGNLGAQVEFYHEACVCDIAKHSNLAMHKPPVCMMAWHCVGVGAANSTDLLQDYCDVLSLTSIVPNDANSPFFITLIVGVLCLIFTVLWFAILRHQQRADAYDAEELSDLDLQMGDMSSGGPDLAFVNPMFDMGDEIADARTVTNPLYLSNVEQISADELTAADDAANVNYQADEGDVLDLQLFDLGGGSGGTVTSAFDSIPTSPQPTPDDPVVEPESDSPQFPNGPTFGFSSGALIVLAGVKDDPWMSVCVEVDSKDVTFSVDGSVLSTAPLAAPLRDGAGRLCIGQRAPGRYSFHGAVADLELLHGRDVGGDLQWDEETYELIPLADDVNGTVANDPAHAGAKVFDGSKNCFLEVPSDVQPAPSDIMRISFRVKLMSDTKGYVVAKTDPSGTTRFWAVGMVKSKAGLSIQFYYHPENLSIGHRLLSANQGRYTSGTMDTEYLIVGEMDKLEGDQLEEYRAYLRQETYKLRSDMASVGGMHESMRRSAGGNAQPRRSKRGPSRSKSVLRRLSKDTLADPRIEEEASAQAMEAQAQQRAAPVEMASMGAGAVSAEPMAGSASNPIAAQGLGSTLVATRRKGQRRQTLSESDEEEESGVGNTMF